MTDTRSPQAKQGVGYETSTSTRYVLDRIFAILVFVATIFGLVVLGALLVDVFVDGLPQLSLDFITNFPSSLPDSAGIFPALIGSLWLLALTALIAVPLGIGAAVYLEEYAADTWANWLVEINISNLAGVPSIVYGLLALGIFVNVLQPITGGKTVISGALALSLLVLPVIIIATREALRAIPDTVREGGYALGATRWEVIRYHLLPMALPGALTGTILALSRAVGETAPLLVVGAVTFITFAPEPFSEFTALPIQIYYWISQPQDEFKLLAATAIVVLMAVLILTNAFAIWLRNRTQRGN